MSDQFLNLQKLKAKKQHKYGGEKPRSASCHPHSHQHQLAQDPTSDSLQSRYQVNHTSPSCDIYPIMRPQKVLPPFEKRSSNLRAWNQWTGCFRPKVSLFILMRSFQSWTISQTKLERRMLSSDGHFAHHEALLPVLEDLSDKLGKKSAVLLPSTNSFVPMRILCFQFCISYLRNWGRNLQFLCFRRAVFQRALTLCCLCWILFRNCWGWNLQFLCFRGRFLCSRGCSYRQAGGAICRQAAFFKQFLCTR
ncbi:hypothetical protein BJ741DRAFT_282021 [Chytriomyces cf. hyalinus JEL632]|nr:hypothetical protein BJ741DRAFT_282021 [Chytriomyces cf. hyalinus JEL632]